MDVRCIRIGPRQSSLLQATISQAIFWGFLVGVTGYSRVWFGSAVILDIMVVLFALLAVVATSHRLIGRDVSMTVEQLRDYVADGCPLDAHAWQQAQRRQWVRR